MPDHDVAIIGAGAAGLSVAATAASLGLKVVLFEREKMGGKRLNTGGMATEALIAAARAAVMVRRAGHFGLRAEAPTVDWAGLRRHLQGAVEQAAKADPTLQLAGREIELVRASAHFVAPDKVEAGGRVHSFRRAVIAAGSEPVVPDLSGLVSCPWLTQDNILDLAEPPAHLLILGAGSQGVELAQAYARLGCRVSLVEAASNILVAEDTDLRLPIREALRQDGVVLHENTRVAGVERHAEGVALVLESGARIPGSHLLLALGEAPRLAPLDLAAANIAATPRGVTTGRNLRSTTNRRVWAAGGIADPEGLGPSQLTEVAEQHAAVIARSMLLRRPAQLDYSALPRLTRTAPELLQVGLTEAAARAAGHEPRILRQPFAANARAIAEGETEGMVKLVLGSGGRLLGAGVVGQGVAELAGVLGFAIAQAIPAERLATLALPPGTRAEAIRRAAAKAGPAMPLSGAARGVVGFLNRLP